MVCSAILNRRGTALLAVFSAAFFGMLIAPARAVEPVSEWRMHGGGAQHTGEIEVTLGNAAPVKLWDWSHNMTTAIQEVCVGGGRVFVTPYVRFNPTMIFAFNAVTGEPLWEREFPPNANSITPPSYHAGKVLFQRGNHGGDTQLWCLQAGTGATVWESPFGTQWERYESPTIADGKIFINGGSYGGMYGFDFDTGEELFFHGLEQEDGWTPTVYNGKIAPLRCRN